jgi:uncharacterized protein
MTIVLTMLAIQCVLGGLDNLWHYEITEKLPQRPSARAELALHTAREFLYAVIFIGIAWWRWNGTWTLVLIAILAIEIGVTLSDFVVEDRTRRLPWFERVLHTVLAINFGAILAVWAPELRQWVIEPTGFAGAAYGIWSWAMTAFGVGVFVWSVRDLLVVRLGVPEWQRHPIRAHHAAAARTVLITGATGFIGRAVTRSLIKRGDRVLALTRDLAKATYMFGPQVDVYSDLGAVPSSRRIDAIVNLAGEALIGGLWTRARKRRFVASRIGTTEALVGLIARLERKSEVLISGSAIGYYGDRADAALDEKEPAQKMFMSELCRTWEEVASGAETYGVRVCRLRIGLVLGRDGGALPAMALAARLGLGAVIGQGGQYVSWIHLRDLGRLILFAIDDARLSGPVNAVAPNPVSQRDFTRALADHWHRPMWFAMPARLLRAMAGEMSDLLLTSQRVVPEVALAHGFHFAHQNLTEAVSDIFAPAPRMVTPLWVYFNEPCSVCRAEMNHYQAEATRAGCPLEFKPIGVSTYDVAAYGLTDTDLRRRFYVSDAEGRMASGVDAFIALWHEMPRYRWAAKLIRLPVLYRIAVLLYDGIAVPWLALLNRRSSDRQWAGEA